MTRIIKKYPNRRLYDTELSRYIVLDDIKTLVLNHTPFQVIDAKTQEDLTNVTLLQIITELEQQGMPIFTTAILQQFIRFYGNPLQKMVSEFLEKSMVMVKAQPTPNPFLQSLTAQQMQLWQTLQQHWQAIFSGKQ